MMTVMMTRRSQAVAQTALCKSPPPLTTHWSPGMLDQEKVEVARVTCEVERRQREKEARMEKQRNMEATRSQHEGRKENLRVKLFIF